MVGMAMATRDARMSCSALDLPSPTRDIRTGSLTLQLPSPWPEVTPTTWSSGMKGSTNYLSQEYRPQAPWSPSTAAGQLAATDTRFGGWRKEVASGAVLQPNGWPAPYSIDGVFDPLPADAKRFIWESDDGIWVNGDLADGYLRKLMLKGSAPTTAMRIARPPSEAEAARALPRRCACQVNAGAIEQTSGCLCKRYDPMLVVPLSLIDKIELNNELRPTVKKLVAESNIGATLRRAGLERADIAMDVMFKRMANVQGHRIRFQVRQEKKMALLESGGESLAAGIEERLERAEFELNSKMLFDLKDWCDRYRSLKNTRRCENARRQVLEAAHDAVAGKGRQDDAEVDPGELVPQIAAAHRSAALAGPYRCLMTCRCGHAEVWHEKPLTEASTPKQALSASASAPLLKPPGPATLMRDLPAQEPIFPMVAEPPVRRAPTRQMPEPSISGGKLLLQKAGVQALKRLSAGAQPAAEMDALAGAAQDPSASDPTAAAASSSTDAKPASPASRASKKERKVGLPRSSRQGSPHLPSAPSTPPPRASPSHASSYGGK